VVGPLTQDGPPGPRTTVRTKPRFLEQHTFTRPVALDKRCQPQGWGGGQPLAREVVSPGGTVEQAPDRCFPPARPCQPAGNRNKFCGHYQGSCSLARRSVDRRPGHDFSRGRTSSGLPAITTRSSPWKWPEATVRTPFTLPLTEYALDPGRMGHVAATPTARPTTAVSVETHLPLVRPSTTTTSRSGGNPGQVVGQFGKDVVPVPQGAPAQQVDRLATTARLRGGRR